MTWHVGPVHVPTDYPTPMPIITGVCIVPFPSYPQPFEYKAAPPPPPREWVNSDNTVWLLMAEYRKPSRGDNGSLGTYRTHEKARAALADWVMEQWDRGLTVQEEAEGEVCDGDVYVYIVEQELE